jgi:hypothetical protein
MGDEALFGGNTISAMKLRLGVPAGRQLSDFLPTSAFKAKNFASGITSFNIEKANL